MSFRSLVESRLGRLRAVGLRGMLEIERDTLRRIGKSTLAATLAWEAAALLNSPRPVLASLGAILVVQVTVRASLARSIQLTIGVMFGLVAATALGHYLGSHWWSIGLTVLVGLIAGEILRLGPFSSQAAISALLALSLGSAYGLLRAEDTVVGAIIGVVINTVISPPTYVGKASRDLRRVSEDLAVLLGDIGAGLARWPARAEIVRWLDRARAADRQASGAADTVSQGEESLRFNPRRRAELHTLHRIGEARRAIEHAVTQTRGITRSLLDLADILPAQPAADDRAALAALGELLKAAGREVVVFGRLQQHPHPGPDRDAAMAARQHASELVERASAALRGSTLEDACARQLAAVLVDAQRLVGEVDVTDGPHAAAVAPPAAEH